MRLYFYKTNSNKYYKQNVMLPGSSKILERVALHILTETLYTFLISSLSAICSTHLLLRHPNIINKQL
jgi:hypothetical protein